MFLHGLPGTFRLPHVKRRVIGLGLALLAALAISPLAGVQYARAGTDDYPAAWKNAAPDTVVDSWGEYNRECTSFAAFRLSTRNGFTMPFHDNASGWGTDAASRGYAVNMTPGIGSIAWWSSGHVAWVEAISGSNVTIEEYNISSNHTYSERTIAASSVSGYIHFQDLPPAGSWGGVGASSTFLGTDTLAAGQQIGANQYILSADARFALLLQSDGNLVLYGGGAMWSSGTGGSGATRLVMQTDGNLVLYNGSTPKWSSGTGGTGSAHLTLQTDGNLVTYNDASGGPTWWTGTGGHTATTAYGSDSLAAGNELGSQQYLRSSDKRYGLLLQSDGNLVLYGPGYHVLWYSGTSEATRLAMQTDGNLVLYNFSTPAWFTATGGTGAAHLSLQTDGNLVVYNNANSAVEWQSGTNGKI